MRIPNTSTCHDAANGNLSIAISGGSEPYTISWEDGSSEYFLNDVAAGEHCVTVSDANGCQVIG